MNHWKVILNTGEIVEEGSGEWVEIPGQSLPWRRLCESLEKEGKWIDTLSIVTPKGDVDVTSLGDYKSPEYYSIQTDLVVDNVLGGATATSTLHVASHYENNIVIHTHYNDEGLFDLTVSKEEYNPLVPSPSRSI